MSPEEYISTRLDPQQAYCSSKSRINKNWYYFFKSAIILIAVVIPVMSGYLKHDEDLKYVVGGLSILLGLFNGIEVFFKFHEKWVNYRTTAEALKQEKYLFLTKAGHYRADPTLEALAERVETILAKENASWNRLIDEHQNKKTKTGK